LVVTCGHASSDDDYCQTDNKTRYVPRANHELALIIVSALLQNTFVVSAGKVSLISAFQTDIIYTIRKRRSIMEGYTTEEVVECYADYVKDGKMIGLPIPLHEGRLRGRGRMGQKSFVDRDYNCK
jgi:hypothetical protein